VLKKPLSCEIPAVSAAASLRRLERPSRHSFGGAPRLARNFGNFAAEKAFSTPSKSLFEISPPEGEETRELVFCGKEKGKC
jgi:hypothetical protein